MMKRLLVIFPIALLVLAGCGKSQKPQDNSTSAILAFPKLQQVFASAPQPLQASVVKIGTSTRYRLYPEVIAELDKLAVDTSLTPEQQKAVTEFGDLVKKEAAKPGQ